MTAIAEKWLPSTRAGNPVTLMSTELDSLGTTGTATSSAIDNDADHDTLVDLELVITYPSAPTANSVIECYVVRQVDGSNCEDVPPADGFVGAFVLSASTSAQRRIIRNVLLPPGDFKIHVIAKTTGQTAASSGNTIKGNFYGLQAI